MARFLPSLLIALYAAIAFAVARLVARLCRSRHARIAAGIVVVAVSVALAVYIFATHVIWQTVLIPICAVLGYFTYGHDDLAPGIFP